LCIWEENQVRFPSGATREEGILQLVHNDVFGPVSVPSLGKYVYYVSFIDEFSGIHGYISSGRNMKSLTGLKSLRLLWRIKQRK
jgi:hypothetical protein